MPVFPSMCYAIMPQFFPYFSLSSSTFRSSSFVQGLRTFVGRMRRQRCEHWEALRPGICIAISFHFPGNCSQSVFRSSSSSIVQIFIYRFFFTMSACFTMIFLLLLKEPTEDVCGAATEEAAPVPLVAALFAPLVR